MIVQRVAGKIYVLFGERSVADLRGGPLGRGLPKAGHVQFRFSARGTLERTLPAGLVGPGYDHLLRRAREAALERAQAS